MDHSNKRILELGSWTYFKDEYPRNTTLLWTGERKPHPRLERSDYIDCTPWQFMRAMRDVRAGKYDLVVAYMPQRPSWHPRYWARAVARQPLRPVASFTRVFGVALLRWVKFRTPLAVLDMNDGFIIGGHNFFLLDRADVVFKRELPADRWHTLCGSLHPALPSRRIRRNPRWIRRLSKIQPIALPAARIDTRRLWQGDFPEKTTDLFFSGEVEENSWVRRTGMAELAALKVKGFAIDVPDRSLPQAEFLQRMSKAWLAWSPAGFSWECYRTAEAAQCLTVPIVNYPTVERHRPLRHDEHALFYDLEAGGLTSVVEQALADKPRLMDMAIAAREHVLAHHLTRAMVDHVIATTLQSSQTPSGGNPDQPANFSNSFTTRS